MCPAAGSVLRISRICPCPFAKRGTSSTTSPKQQTPCFCHVHMRQLFATGHSQFGPEEISTRTSAESKIVLTSATVLTVPWRCPVSPWVIGVLLISDMIVVSMQCVYTSARREAHQHPQLLSSASLRNVGHEKGVCLLLSDCLSAGLDTALRLQDATLAGT